MCEHLVDGADELHGDHVEAIGPEGTLPGPQVRSTQKTLDYAEVLPAEVLAGRRSWGRKQVAIERLGKPGEERPRHVFVFECFDETRIPIFGAQELLGQQAPVLEIGHEYRTQ